MGDNKEERKKMKKTRYVALVLLSSLLTLVGCSRREILDDYPVTGINIRLDWEGVTGRLPERSPGYFLSQGHPRKKD